MSVCLCLYALRFLVNKFLCVLCHIFGLKIHQNAFTPPTLAGKANISFWRGLEQTRLTKVILKRQQAFLCHPIKRRYFKQESRAVARKPRDAAAVVFGLKFADNIHYKFKSSQASKAKLQSSKRIGAKQFKKKLTQNGHSRSRVLESVERR